MGGQVTYAFNWWLPTLSSFGRATLHLPKRQGWQSWSMGHVSREGHRQTIQVLLQLQTPIHQGHHVHTHRYLYIYYIYQQDVQHLLLNSKLTPISQISSSQLIRILSLITFCLYKSISIKTLTVKITTNIIIIWVSWRDLVIWSWTHSR